jgi:hypothetical protein
VSYRAAVQGLRALLANDATALVRFGAVVEAIHGLAEGTTATFLDPPGRRLARLTIWIGLSVVIGCLAFLAVAVGAGLGSRGDLMSRLALIGLALAGIAFPVYVVAPLLPPSRSATAAAALHALMAAALGDRLPDADRGRLLEPWRMAMERVPASDPPRSWRTAVVAGRFLLMLVSGGAMAIIGVVLLGQI